ncbi:MAG: hypothetical protein A3I00_00595 [Betaproteobacteria bacterium RIFCSPLOWO2_02_FULL_64_12]|nr:MAG: hypothetical protein A3I00_00595 [Betaproteobacteria bacterium RIFCSPLOWO2_02_FULL_64_12]
MGSFSNELDVARQVKTTDPAAVKREVDRIFRELYPDASTAVMDRAFQDCARMFGGELAGYRACDTAYHDIQHTMEVTLAMARLIDGYERGRVGVESIDEKLFRLGVITALFHDAGYILHNDEKDVKNGAEYTLIHVSRGAQFLKEYLPRIGMADMADVAASLIHFTGYEQPVASIRVPGLIYRLLGNLLGSADIIGQMSDRCYLEKCRDRLYPEFVAGGLTRKRTPEGGEQVVFASGEDLVMKTPNFYTGASKRLNSDLEGCYVHVERHFGGQNLYFEELSKNIRFAQGMAKQGDTSALHRIPPDTLAKPETGESE